MADAVSEAIAILPDKNVMEDMLLKLEAKINQIVLEEISKAMKPLCAKIEKLELKHDIYKAHFTGIEPRLDEAEQRLDEAEQKLDEAEQKLDDAEQYSRRACLRIYGIPLPKSFESADDSLSKVKGVFKEVEVEVPDEVIDRVHRIGKKEKNNQGMTVKCTSWKHRTAVYKGRKRLKDKQIRLDLTSRRARLLKLVEERPLNMQKLILLSWT